MNRMINDESKREENDEPLFRPVAQMQIFDAANNCDLTESLAATAADNRVPCAYIHRFCLQNRLEGYDYCMRHILGDKSAPFKQCTFVHPVTSKKCPNAARRTERRVNQLCPWHLKKQYLNSKNRLSLQKTQSLNDNKIENSETVKISSLLKKLEHHCPSSSSHEKVKTNIDWIKYSDGFTASDNLRQRIIEADCEMQSAESDEEMSNPYLEDLVLIDGVDSDSENRPNDQEDVLRHAGVYTAEEAYLQLRDKMMKLQKLYIEEFKHYQYLLKEKYKKFLINLQHERELHEVENEIGSNPVEIPQLDEEQEDKLCALKRYHRYHGQEALLKQKYREKRRQTLEGDNFKPKQFAKCIYNKDEPCLNRSLPLSHYCQKHVLYDENQVLFRPCAAGDTPCLNRIISIRKNNTCLIHKDITSNKELDNLLSQTPPEIAPVIEMKEEEKSKIETLKEYLLN